MDYFLGDELLLGGQDDRESLLLAQFVPLDHTVQSGGFPGFGVHVELANSVDLDVESIIGEVLLVDVIAIAPDPVFVDLVCA